MVAYLKLEDLDFGMASPTRYRTALQAAGFDHVSLRNRNRWYFEEAKGELARMMNDRPRFDETMGKEEIDIQVELWQAMLVVLENGEHCPHHFRGQKPMG